MAGELNSEQLESATQRGHYKDGDLVFLWKSDPIPTDPITVRGDLPPAFKARLTVVLQTLDLTALPEADRKIMGLSGTRFVPQTDGAYDGIRDLVKTLQHRPREAELSARACPTSVRCSRCAACRCATRTASWRSPDVDLDVRAGELLIVLGGNGCGKTTLLRCITRSLTPTAGEVWLDGADICRA